MFPFTSCLSSKSRLRASFGRSAVFLWTGDGGGTFLPVEKSTQKTRQRVGISISPLFGNTPFKRPDQRGAAAPLSGRIPPGTRDGGRGTRDRGRVTRDGGCKTAPGAGYSSRHCEPVRTLARQSVFPGIYPRRRAADSRPYAAAKAGREIAAAGLVPAGR